MSGISPIHAIQGCPTLSVYCHISLFFVHNSWTVHKLLKSESEMKSKVFVCFEVLSWKLGMLTLFASTFLFGFCKNYNYVNGYNFGFSILNSA